MYNSKSVGYMGDLSHLGLSIDCQCLKHFCSLRTLQGRFLIMLLANKLLNKVLLDRVLPNIPKKILLCYAWVHAAFILRFEYIADRYVSPRGIAGIMINYILQLKMIGVNGYLDHGNTAKTSIIWYVYLIMNITYKHGRLDENPFYGIVWHCCLVNCLWYVTYHFNDDFIINYDYILPPSFGRSYFCVGRTRASHRN